MIGVVATDAPERFHADRRLCLQAGLDALSLQAQQHQIVATLSSGQQRKASLLRLWITEANIWVLDEPFAALDTASSQIVMRHLERHILKGGQLIITSHVKLNLPAMILLRLK